MKKFQKIHPDAALLHLLPQIQNRKNSELIILAVSQVSGSEKAKRQLWVVLFVGICQQLTVTSRKTVSMVGPRVEPHSEPSPSHEQMQDFSPPLPPILK